MTAKHTPQPWRVLRRANQRGTSSVMVVGRANAPICEPERHADADLIAAAPELLALLQEMLPRFRDLRELGGFGASDLCERASAAVAKATGS